MSFWRKHIVSILLGIVVVFYLFNGIHYLRGQSITSDEGSFMHYAIRFLKGNPDRIHPVTDNSKMPISVLNTIPRVVSDAMSNNKDGKTDWGISDTMNGRYVTLFVSVLTILLVFTWAKELYGTWSGLFAAFLMSLCPNNLANAGLVTTDSYSVFFLLLCMYLLWKFCTLRSTRYFILFSIAIALSQLVKQSLFHLYVLCPLIMLVYFLLQRSKFGWKPFLTRAGIFILINLVVINAGYYFHGSFLPLRDYAFMSDLFQAARQFYPASWPMPFPKPFIDGLDMAKYYDQVGGGIDGVSSFGKPTILDQSRTGGSFWYYYFVSIFYKTPLAYFILFLWAQSKMRQRDRGSFFEKEFFLLAPIVYFLVVLSFFYKTQCGLRHILFIYPLLFICCSSIVLDVRSLSSKILLGFLSLALVIDTSLYWGNYFPYTNTLITDKKNAFRKVGSANLEFHQGYYFAEAYMKEHPDVRFAPTVPASGKFLITTEDYEDVWNRHQYDWIRKYEPVDHVAFNYLLIDTEKKKNARP